MTICLLGIHEGVFDHSPYSSPEEFVILLWDCWKDSKASDANCEAQPSSYVVGDLGSG